MRQANATYMGEDPASAQSYGAASPNGNGNGMPTPPLRSAIDLRNVSFGGQTFSNPCFWILLGVAGTILVQYMMTRQKKSGGF